MNKNQELNDLKKWALLSGFPLENDALKILQDSAGSSAAIERDIPFPGIDGDGKSHLRSIDFKCSVRKQLENFPHYKNEVDIDNLHFIVDAKYTSDEDKQRCWFVPAVKPASDYSFPYLVPKARFKDAFGEGRFTMRKDLIEFASCGSSLRLASTGRKVSELKESRDSLAGYQVQILQATANFIRQDYQRLNKADESTGKVDGTAHFYIPIVVTNAPLFILRPGIVIADVDSAKRPDSICDEVDSVLVEAPNIRHLKDALVDLSRSTISQGSQLRWMPCEYEIAPTLFCRISAFKALVDGFISRFSALPVRS